MSALQLTERTLDIIDAIARPDGASATIADVQHLTGHPRATVHRIIRSLMARGFVLRTGDGRYRPGMGLLGLAESCSKTDLLASVARPHMQRLSRRMRSHAHLGVWTDSMVTYLVKQKYGKGRIHSAEGCQLEAYCSAIGKILLAGLPDKQLQDYLSEGDFVALTQNTFVDPIALGEEIKVSRLNGFAVDNGEMADDLKCIAVPVIGEGPATIAGLSLSFIGRKNWPSDIQGIADEITETANAIHRALFPQSHSSKAS